ncbi:MAG: hypothetical protein CVV24_04995 [Ignavibacteriae bacterium HGW-Ignavibacteriae-3]|nr:MAG: hypothetical protein CVV24_04995 [Ignavibacteriae bacterium HGW-Ignavibacteriae-3]
MKILTIIIMSLMGINGADTTSVKIYTSRAMDLKNDKLIYREFHEEKFAGDRIVKSITKYKDTQNNVLSERIMDFADDLTKPKFVLNDFRSGYIEGAEPLSGNNVRVYTRENFDGRLEEKILKVNSPFVIDGGLTYFFRENWEDLLKGKTVEFNFITPAKLDYFRFRVSKNSIIEVGGRKGLQIKLEINSFILRAFVDPILITYALDNKEILHYKGISNVNDENGKSYSVEIDFTNKNG